MVAALLLRSAGSVCESHGDQRAAARSDGAPGLLQGSEVFEGSSPGVAGQVLVEVVLEGLDTVTIGGIGAEADDVKAWGVRQVDGEGLRQHQELVFLGAWGRAGGGGGQLWGRESRFIQSQRLEFCRGPFTVQCATV